MAVSNPPSFSSVRNEFSSKGMGLASNLYAYRRGGGIVPESFTQIGYGTPSSPLKLSQFAGISAIWTATVTTNQANFNFYNWAVANGYPGSGDAQIIIAPGVFIYGSNGYNSTGTFPGMLYIINKGFIIGQGGDGGYSYTNYNNQATSGPASAGMVALQLNCNTTIDNTNGYIGGGGGGGGAAGPAGSATGGGWAGGGGGAGGGRGGRTFDPATSAWTPGGGPGQVGSTGAASGGLGAGGGGGRIIPGSTTVGPTAGTNNSTTKTGVGGNGGSGGGSGAATAAKTNASDPIVLVTGGSGGGSNNTGGNPTWNGNNGFGQAGGGGGGWGAAGGGNALNTTGGDQPGAAGGAAIDTSDYFPGGYYGGSWYWPGTYVPPSGGTWTLSWIGGFNPSRVFGAIL